MYKYIIALTVFCLLIEVGSFGEVFCGLGFFCCCFFNSPLYPSVIFIVLQHPLPQGTFSTILQEFVEPLRGVSLLIILQDVESKRNVIFAGKGVHSLCHFWQM